MSEVENVEVINEPQEEETEPIMILDTEQEELGKLILSLYRKMR